MAIPAMLMTWSSRMDDLHEQLMKEFRIYYTNYQQFAVERTMASAKRTRANLMQMIKLSQEMRQALLDTYKERQRRHSEKYRKGGVPRDKIRRRNLDT